MISLTKPAFWRLYNNLPADVRTQARLAYGLFVSDPFHPGLQFKKLAGSNAWWSVRIGLHYRAIGERNGDTIRWFWIGSHSEFDKLAGG